MEVTQRMDDQDVAVPLVDLVAWHNEEAAYLDRRQAFLDRGRQGGNMTPTGLKGLEVLEAALRGRRKVLESFSAFLQARSVVIAGKLEAFLRDLEEQQ